MTMQEPALITVLTAFLLAGVAINVHIRRAKYGIKALATNGDPRYEVAYGIQLNTVEMTLPFVAALWVFAAYVSAAWSGLLGGLYLLGRVVYAISYTVAPEKSPLPGLLIALLSFLCLLFGGLYGAIRAFFV